MTHDTFRNTLMCVFRDTLMCVFMLHFAEIYGGFINRMYVQFL